MVKMAAVRVHGVEILKKNNVISLLHEDGSGYRSSKVVWLDIKVRFLSS